MTEATPNLLLVNADPLVTARVLAALAALDGLTFHVEVVSLLSSALTRLEAKDISAILLNLSLPDCQGLAAFHPIYAASPETPILVLGKMGEEELAIDAVKAGAQDFIILPSHLDAYALTRALRNAMERKSIEDALYLEKERALVTLNSIGDAVLCTDISGNITYLNLVAETMTGWARTEAVGQPLRRVFRIIDGATRKTARDPLEMAVEQNRTVGLTMNCILIRRDGYESAIEDSAAPIHDRAGNIIGAVIVFHDVTAARAMSLQMTYSAQHDLVTNLPNRLMLNDRISQAIALATRQKRRMAVLFLDLDNFKYVNDSLGHAVGDKLLQSVAQRLLASLRASDTVSRQGGDEFVMLLSSLDSEEDAAASAKRILRSLNEPHTLGEQTLHINASLGISLYPKDGAVAEALIQNADTAMYHAKQNGRNNFQFFKPEMNERAVARQSIENSLRHAVNRDEFKLHYQTKVDLKTGRILGVEALIRWYRPNGEVVPPVRFVPVAEESGLIVEIGRWVLREACRQAREWHDLTSPSITVAINVSAFEFSDPGFVEAIRAALAAAGLESKFLEIELTERVLMKDIESTSAALRELKAMGVVLAIDDFGTGYSSLSYLQEFPIDALKIDRSFVQRIPDAHGNSPIVSAIINLAESLHLVAVAEGIETQEQKEFLISQNCPQGQGYLFTRPVPAAQMTQLLERNAVAFA
jgi:diguanylate cyclase (GGDEF)-like protein/PAS domain S-box-containing protein